MKKTIFVGSLLLSTNLFASGLSKPVNVGPRAIGMGGAFVGVADDTTSIFHNPAGMTQLQGNHNIQMGADTLITGLKYTPPAAPTEESEKNYIPVPTFGYVNNQLKILSFGVGVFFPHGSGGKFNGPSASPGNPNEGRIYTMEIDPAVAWQITPELSIGAALRVTRISTNIQGQLVPLSATVIDNLEDLSTSGWGYGAAAGLLWKAAPWLQIGGNYRSNITKTLSGDGTFTTLGNFDADFKFKLPTLVTGGFAATLFKKWMVSFQYDWERNSEVDQFVITSPDLGGAPATLTIPENYRDSHTYHFGVKYDACKMVTLLAGYARDFNTSIPDESLNRITGDIDSHDATAGVIVNFSRYNIGLAWDGRFGERDVPAGPATSPNPSPGHYESFLHTISANVGVRL